MTLLVTDTFAARTVSGGFGTASDGHTWAIIDGNETYAVGSGEGTATGKTNSSTFQLSSTTAADIEGLVRTAGTAVAYRSGVALRIADLNNFYLCRINGSTNKLELAKVVAGTTTVVASAALTPVANTFYWIRFRTQGTTLSGKVWQSGSSEPGAWTVTVTDSAISAAGGFGLACSASATATVVKYDSFTATGLQNTLDILVRAGVLNHKNTLDILARARLAGLATRDVLMRARLAVPTTTRTKDILARARVAGLGLADIVCRAGMEEQIIALPAPVAAIQTVAISGVSYPVLEASLDTSETLDGRSTCAFTIKDATGQLHLRHRQRVTVTHVTRGVVFTGFITSATEQNLPPNTMNTIRVVCIDEHYIPDKRAHEGNEAVNQYAGDIAAGLVSLLAADGITAGYAFDHDTTTADFAQGTLSNVVASANIGGTALGDGDLELAPAGSPVSITEGATNDFGLGTLTNTQALSTGGLALASSPALKLTGQATIPGGGNLYTYQKIYQTPGYTIQSGDTLTYGVWVSSSSPKIMAAIDIVFTDGSTMRDFNSQGIVDQLGVPAHPGSDLSGYANDQWYTRTFSLTALAGKTTAYVTVALEGDSVGTYTAYFRHAQLLHGSTLQVTIFESALNFSPPQQIANSGYTNVSVSVVTAYEQSGTRISPAYALSAAGIARQSLISWTAALPSGMTAGVEASFDGGATYQACTNGQPIPGLLPGMSTPGRTLVLRETLTNGTPSPEQTPQLSALTATLLPSWNAQKRDVITTTNTLSSWSAGTFSGSSQYVNGHFTLNGFTRNWENGVTSNQTLFGNSSPVAFVQSRTFGLQSGATGAATSRLDFAGTWTNFTCEVDVLIGGTSNINMGIVYRTTGWQNNNDTYAYSAFVNTSAITLGRGTNSASGAGTFTQIATAPLTLSSGNWHRLKLVVSGSNHQVFLDEVRYLNATDGTYTGAGSIGLRLYNNAGATQSTLFDNFGVALLLTAQRVSPPVDLSSAVVAQDSYIGWTASTPGSSMLTVEAAIDGGTVWFPCTNGAAIPAIARGYNLAGLSLKTRVTMTTSDVTSQPAISALSTWVIGEMSASGSRISPPLSLSAVGRVGSSLAQWSATTPLNTALGIDVSPDGITWTDVSNLNGGTIPFLVSQAAPYVDGFDIDTSASYVSAAVGTQQAQNATWVLDTPNSQVIGTGGTHAFFSPAGLILGDGEVIVDTDRADFGGVVWRLSPDLGTCYELSVQDSASSRTPNNRMKLFKVVNGQYTQLGLGVALSFARGTPTRFKIVQEGGQITITVNFPSVMPDGAVVGGITQTLRYTDSSPLSAGAVGLRSNGGINRYQQLYVLSYGDDVSNRALYTRQRLTSTDPTASPQVQDLIVGCRSNTIDAGVLIPATTYSTLSGSINTLAQDLDDLAKQSNAWWRIRQGIFSFKDRAGMLAPFPLTGADMLYGARVSVTRQSALYRNEQIIIGGTDIEAVTLVRIADGVRTGFDTEDPVDSITSILVNGQAQSFGIQGVDSGKQWYYQQGKQGITADVASAPLAANTQVSIAANVQIQVIAKARNEGQITLLASLDGTSGVVTVVEQAHGLNSAAVQQLAISRLQENGVLATDLAFTTCRPGLRAGHYVAITLPQHGLLNASFLVTQVDYSARAATINGLATMLEYFKVACTDGPIVGSWARMFSN